MKNIIVTIDGLAHTVAWVAKAAVIDGTRDAVNSVNQTICNKIFG